MDSLTVTIILDMAVGPTVGASDQLAVRSAFLKNRGHQPGSLHKLVE
jgi:hypothetical protein